MGEKSNHFSFLDYFTSGINITMTPNITGYILYIIMHSALLELKTDNHGVR